MYPGGTRGRIMTIRTARYNRAGRFALAFAAAAMLAACTPPTRGTALRPVPQPAAPAEPQVNLSAPAPVALLLPVGAEGGVAAEAQGIANAAMLAAEELGGNAVALRIYDTAGGLGGGPGGAAAAARRALDDGAALLLGPLFGSNVGAAASVAAARGVNVISFSTDANVAGANVWLVGQLPSTEAARIVSFAAGAGYSRIGVFAPDTPYGVAATRAVQDGARRAGAMVAAQGSYNRSFEGIQAAAAPYAKDHLASGAQAVVLPEEGDGLRSAAAFLDFNGVSPRSGKYLGLSIWSKDPGIVKERALQGGWFAAPDPFRLSAFERRYAARYGAAPSRLAHLGYDAAAAAVAMVESARAARLITPFDWTAITDPAGFSGAAGAFRFTPEGLNQRALAVLEVAPEGFIVVDPAPVAAGGRAGL
jgi:branched-chain amino acid transport system substrate-binding protein